MFQRFLSEILLVRGGSACFRHTRLRFRHTRPHTSDSTARQHACVPPFPGPVPRTVTSILLGRLTRHSRVFQVPRAKRSYARYIRLELLSNSLHTLVLSTSLKPITMTSPTMRAAVAQPGNTDLVLRTDYPVPKPGDGEVLVKVAASGGTCTPLCTTQT